MLCAHSTTSQLLNMPACVLCCRTKCKNSDHYTQLLTHTYILLIHFALAVFCEHKQMEVLKSNIILAYVLCVCVCVCVCTRVRVCVSVHMCMSV